MSRETDPKGFDAAGLDAGSFLDDLLTRARKAGAEAADAVLVEGTSISQAQRLGKVERLERAEGLDLGLRVLIGQRQACVASSDIKADAVAELVERAIAMARSVPEDPYCGLADPSELAKDWPALESEDPGEPAPETLIERAQACEAAARAVPGVTNSEGAEASWSRSRVHLAATNGFMGSYRRSSHSVGVSVLAGEGTEMERDYDFSTAVFAEDMEDPAAVGARAGERAVKRLGAERPKTGRYPVVFHPRVARSLVASFLGAISGPSVARGTSFLKDAMGTQVFARGVTILDDPLRPRGLRSKPFDAEGLLTQRRALIEDGDLEGWLLSLSSARQLGLRSTGNAARGTGAPPSPSPTNVTLQPGSQSPEDLIGEIEEGLYVIEMIGSGVNPVTGDYSRGAAGFWIRGGQLAEPVSELTLAGNLKEMFLALTPANDLKLRTGIDAPTLRVEAMTVAGD